MNAVRYPRDKDRNEVTKVRRDFVANRLTEIDSDKTLGTITAARLTEMIGEEGIHGSKPYTRRMAVGDLKKLAELGILIKTGQDKYIFNRSHYEDRDKEEFVEEILELGEEFN